MVFMFWLETKSQNNIYCILVCSSCSYRIHEWNILGFVSSAYRLKFEHCLPSTTCIVLIIIFDYLLPHIPLTQLIFNEILRECTLLMMKLYKYPILCTHQTTAFVCECSSCVCLSVMLENENCVLNLSLVGVSSIIIASFSGEGKRGIMLWSCAFILSFTGACSFY